MRVEGIGKSSWGPGGAARGRGEGHVFAHSCALPKPALIHSSVTDTRVWWKALKTRPGDFPGGAVVKTPCSVLPLQGMWVQSLVQGTKTLHGQKQKTHPMFWGGGWLLPPASGGTWRSSTRANYNYKFTPSWLMLRPALRLSAFPAWADLILTNAHKGAPHPNLSPFCRSVEYLQA